ncbi:hypothetical protein C1A50_0846 [Paenibacillus polymyxa]|nr:hypothetical protein C1A50_0846 [Paenibacillus polymyxa]
MLYFWAIALRLDMNCVMEKSHSPNFFVYVDLSHGLFIYSEGV